MKIILLNTYNTYGGAAIACKRLQEALTKHTDYEVQRLVQEKSQGEANLRSLSDSWWGKQKARWRFVKERLFFLPFEKDKSVRFAFSPAYSGIDVSKHNLIKKADIIHLHWVNFGFQSLWSLEKLFKLGKPIVWTLHDMWAFTGGCHHSGDCEHYQTECGNCAFLKKPHIDDISCNIWYKKQQIFAENPHFKIVTCSEWLAARARKSSLFAHADIRVIPNPIDINLFKPQVKADAQHQLKLPADKRYILFAAMKTSIVGKGFLYFQAALEQLKATAENSENIELLIMGESDEEMLQALPFRYHNLGALTDMSKIAIVYNAATVFVTPSLFENLPNTIMESLACGTPVVGFRIGGIPEMIDHQENGYIAQYQSVEDLAKGIQAIVFHKNYTFLQENARKKVLKKYSSEIVAHQYAEVYQS